MSTTSQNASVLDIRFIQRDGKQVYQKQMMVNGVPEWKDVETIVEDDKHFMARFSGTDMVPHDMPKDIETSILVKKALDKQKIDFIKETGYIPKTLDLKLVERYMDQLIRIHALLIRVLGTPESILQSKTKNEALSKNTALREFILLLIDVVGNPWKEVVQYI